MRVEHEVELRVIGAPPSLQEDGNRDRGGEEQHGKEGEELLEKYSIRRYIRTQERVLR